MDKFEDTIEVVDNSQAKLVEDLLEIVEDSMEAVEDSMEVVQDSLEIVENSIEVVQDLDDENKPQWLRDKPNVVKSILKTLLPKFY